MSEGLINAVYMWVGDGMCGWGWYVVDDVFVTYLRC